MKGITWTSDATSSNLALARGKKIELIFKFSSKSKTLKKKKLTNQKKFKCKHPHRWTESLIFGISAVCSAVYIKTLEARKNETEIEQSQEKITKNKT